MITSKLEKIAKSITKSIKKLIKQSTGNPLPWAYKALVAADRTTEPLLSYYYGLKQLDEDFGKTINAVGSAYLERIPFLVDEAKRLLRKEQFLAFLKNRPVNPDVIISPLFSKLKHEHDQAMDLLLLTYRRAAYDLYRNTPIPYEYADWAKSLLPRPDVIPPMFRDQVDDFTYELFWKAYDKVLSRPPRKNK